MPCTDASAGLIKRWRGSPCTALACAQPPGVGTQRRRRGSRRVARTAMQWFGRLLVCTRILVSPATTRQVTQTLRCHVQSVPSATPLAMQVFLFGQVKGTPRIPGTDLVRVERNEPAQGASQKNACRATRRRAAHRLASVHTSKGRGPAAWHTPDRPQASPGPIFSCTRVRDQFASARCTHEVHIACSGAAGSACMVASSVGRTILSRTRRACRSPHGHTC